MSRSVGGYPDRLGDEAQGTAAEAGSPRVPREVPVELETSRR
jgi:hypothetical protein